MPLYPKWWRQHFLAVELGIALVATGLLLCWWRYGNGVSILKEVVHGNRGQIYGTFASIFGSLLGFAITALSVVLGFSSSDRLAVLKKSAYYKQLWEVFTSGIRVLGDRHHDVAASALLGPRNPSETFRFGTLSRRHVSGRTETSAMCVGVGTYSRDNYAQAGVGTAVRSPRLGLTSAKDLNRPITSHNKGCRG